MFKKKNKQEEEVLTTELPQTPNANIDNIDSPTVKIPDIKQFMSEIDYEENETANDDTEETETVETEKKAKYKRPKDKSAKMKKPKKSKFARNKELKHGFQVVTTTITWFLSAILFIFCLSNIYQQYVSKDAVGFCGVGNAVVVSESMHPTLKKNDFIVYKQTDIEDLKPGNIVIYKRATDDGEILIVHRLKSITDGYALTRGDNNQVDDDLFEAENIVGKMILCIPQLGVLLQAMSSVWAIVMLVALFGLITVFQVIYKKLQYQKWLNKLSEDKEEQAAIEKFLVDITD